MQIKKITLFLYLGIIMTISSAVMLSVLGVIPYMNISSYIPTSILGVSTSPKETLSVSIAENASPVAVPSQAPLVAASPVSTPVMELPQAQTSPEYLVRILSATKEITEGDIATFTWYVSGIPGIIKTTTVYMGKTSIPEPLDTNISPLSIGYTDWIRDFINGSYKIPLTFTASKTINTSGTYFVRPYVEIEGKHYWGAEQIFTVLPKPKHEIRIVDPPTKVKIGEGIRFTWDIYGPPASTWYTVIVGGKQSRTGLLDETIGIPQTPYAAVFNDFANPPKSIDVPLRFMGSIPANETGVFYFRALALINNKNIWSDEYSFTVE